VNLTHPHLNDAPDEGEIMLELLAIGAVGLGAFAVWNSMRTFNDLMAMDERCNTAFADIDALLKHRHDLIPGLVQNVRSLVGQENRVLDSVLQAVTETMRSDSIEKRLKAEQNLGSTISSLFSNLGDLPKANTSSHFVDLRNSFKDVENRITAARRYYNTTVEEHNATLRQFPGKLIGAKFRIDTRRQYSLGAERMFMDEAVSLTV
jgi:LemA protein